MQLLIRAPFIESERKRLETYFDEIVYDPWTTTGERYYEDEMLGSSEERTAGRTDHRA